MKKLLILLLCILMPSVLFADDFDDDDEPERMEPAIKAVVDVSQYHPSKISIKKSILKIILKNNWVIVEHSKNTIVAKYKNGAKIKVTIQPSGVMIEEVKNKSRFTQKWMNSLTNNFIKNIIYEYHVDKAKSQLGIQ